MPTELTDMIDCVADTGMTNLYGGTGVYSESTYKKVNKVVALMQKLNVPIPGVNAYRVSPYTEFNG